MDFENPFFPLELWDLLSHVNIFLNSNLCIYLCDIKMDYLNSLTSNIKYICSNLKPPLLTGAIDVIVIEQPDGSLLSTPFHIRFGKYGVFSTNEKFVDILINKKRIKKLKMKLAENGVAYFVQETDAAEVPEYLASSPVPGSSTPSSPTSSETVSITYIVLAF